MKKKKTIRESHPYTIKKPLLVMKLSFLLILAASLQVSARSNGQAKVTIKLDQTEISKVLNAIEKQGNFRFLYNSRLQSLQQKVSIDVTEQDIKDVLNRIFSGTDLSYKLLENNLIVILSNTATLQDIPITGKVTGENGEPLSGVSLFVKGTTRGTTSDNNGNFSLTAPENGTLVISYIGYQSQELPINNQSVINIKLVQSSKVMDQVVVVGYGSQRKIDVTGATATVKGAELAKQPVMTATQAVQGKVAGVQIISSGQPGTSPQVRVRGTGTALGRTSVLFVVDGVLTDDISNINTADIINMDILKDASSTAIYGSRGANGVMIITTRKGAVGKTKVSYNGNGGVRMAANLVKMANGAEYANYASSATGLSIVAGSVSTDWYGQILRTAVEQNHNVSLSGGTDKATYFLSAGYLNDQGIVIDNVFKRFTIRSNNDFRLSDKIRVGMQVSYANGNDSRVNIGTAYNNAYRAAPIIAGKVNGKYGNTSSYQNVGNPILDIESQKNPVIDNRLQGAAFIEIKPIKWLTFRSSIGGDLDNINNKSFTKAFNNDTSTFLTFGGNQRNPDSYLNIINSKTFHWTWDNTLTFNKRFDLHNLTLLAGTTSEKSTGDYTTVSQKDVPSDPSLWYIGTGNDNTTQGGTDIGFLADNNYTRNSYIGRVNYSYNDRYLLTASIRGDGSSRFSSKYRWGYFPSVGAGWIVSREHFMESQTLFETLKLRASWGKVGNDNIPSDAYIITVTPNLAYPFGGGTATPGSAITRIKDPNVKWETTTESDLGLEFGLMHNRLTGEIAYYNKTAKDALIFVKIPAVAGDQTGQVLTNAAAIQNTGVEVSLNWTDRLSNSLSYHIGGNITLNKNTVTGLNGGQPLYDGGVASQQFTTKTDNRQPVGSFYVLKVLGVFQSDQEVANYKNPDGTQIQPGAHAGDFKYQKAPLPGGKPPTSAIDITNDRQFVGSYQPKAYYGITAGFNYKSFDFSIDLYGNAGNQVYNGKKAFRLSNGAIDNIESYQAYARWTISNHSQTEPAANGGNLPASTYFVESGSFIRINNVTIGYTVPIQGIEKLKVSSVRIFATSQNTYILKKYSGFTPELPGSPTNAGIETNAYPTTRTIAIGLNVDF